MTQAFMTLRGSRSQDFLLLAEVLFNMKLKAFPGEQSQYLKLDDGVLVHAEITSGDGMLSDFIGNKHHG